MLFFIGIFTSSIYSFNIPNNTTKFIEENNEDLIEFYNGKDVDLLKITSNEGNNYCIVILSSTGTPLSKGRIVFDKSKSLLKEALKTAYLNPDTDWWSIDFTTKDDENSSYINIPVIPDTKCDNGGLTFGVIEYRQPYSFIGVRLADGSIYYLGFIKSEQPLNENEFDFLFAGELYMKNNNKFELLSCEDTNFDCNDRKYANPYQYYY